MDRHIRALANANVIFGCVILVVTIGALVTFEGFGGVAGSFGDRLSGMVAVVALVFNMLLAVPCIVGGIFLRRVQEWSRSVMIVVSALNAVNFPLGTPLGLYGLWVLMSPESDFLFREPFRNAPAHLRPPVRPIAGGREGKPPGPIARARLDPGGETGI